LSVPSFLPRFFTALSFLSWSEDEGRANVITAAKWIRGGTARACEPREKKIKATGTWNQQAQLVNWKRLAVMMALMFLLSEDIRHDLRWCFPRLWFPGVKGKRQVWEARIFSPHYHKCTSYLVA
jgi:hypothetical protein